MQVSGAQANLYLVTAPTLYNFDKDQELWADEFAVLRRKLGALKEAFQRHVESEPEKESPRFKGARVRQNQYISQKLHEYDVNLSSMNRFKQRSTVVEFIKEMTLTDDLYYGEEVAQKAREFLRYWKDKAHPGQQV